MAYLYKIPVIADNGLNYERRAVVRLRAHGYRVRWRRHHKIAAVDCVIEPGITCEIKGSRRRRVNQRCDGFQFVIERRGYSAPIREDFVLLLCVARRMRDDVLFVLPSRLVRNQTTITIPRADPRQYNGVYSVYRENYALLDEHLSMLNEKESDAA